LILPIIGEVDTIDDFFESQVIEGKHKERY